MDSDAPARIRSSQIHLFTHWPGLHLGLFVSHNELCGIADPYHGVANFGWVRCWLMAPRFGCKTACRGALERTYVTFDRQTEELIEAILWYEYNHADVSAADYKFMN